MKSKQHILLLHPPGWSLNYGAPHIALPVIKEYLETAGIRCEIKDLNIELSSYYGVNIVEKDIFPFKDSFDEIKAYDLYFIKAKQLNEIAKQYDGEWKIKSGFNFNNCNLSSSINIREFSQYVSPASEFYSSQLLLDIKKDPPLIIGISITVPSQLLSAFEIIRILRKNMYKGFIVLGGNTITRLKDSLQKDWIFDLIDGIVFNQGEEALEILWKNILSKSSLESVPNLLWRKNGRYFYNGYRKLDKNKFSMPDFSGFPIGNYWGINYLPAISARGCYYGKCSFCAIPYAWGNNGFIGLDNPDKVVAYMINSQKKWGINRFSFVEETMHPASISNIANKLVKSGQPFLFEGYARFENIWKNNDFLKLLSKAGLRKVFIGMELISSEKRNLLNKNDNSEMILDFIKRFYDNNIKVHLFTMFGYPETSKKEAFDTIVFLLKNNKYIDTIDVSHFLYAKHTKVNGVIPVIEDENDWTLDFPIIPNNKNTLNTDEAQLLANALESIVIQEQPKWTHPIYRMLSTWM